MKPMNCILPAMFAVLFIWLGAAPVAMAAGAPEDMLMSAPAGAKATKPPVLFSHKSHDAAKLKCVDCHHKWDGKGVVQGCAAAGCHDNTKSKKGDDSYYLAFHAKAPQSCLGCHKAGKKGPTKCSECHKP